MHEFSVTGSLLAQCERIVAENGCTRMVSVTVRIGVLSGVETSLLRDAFNALKKGTFADGSRMVIEASAVKLRCAECNGESEMQHIPDVCPHCGSDSILPESGMELTLVSLDLA